MWIYNGQVPVILLKTTKKKNVCLTIQLTSLDQHFRVMKGLIHFMIAFVPHLLKKWTEIIVLGNIC